ncbi:MAG: hypothetical protein HY304_06785 [candidate division Zixibacteria bacterium]|nr:hypothetical protein [candidate division Zixibacteria bacterium]
MTHRLNRIGLSALMVGSCVVASGCGGGKGGPPPPTVEKGWQLFAAKDYTHAIAELGAVLAADSSVVEAYVGLGWSYAFIEKLDSAAGQFEAAIRRNSSLADAHAGLSAVGLAQGDRNQAITHAIEALQLDSTWTFAHYPGVNHLDLHLILAQAYFGNGSPSYHLAQVEVNYLDSHNGLDPGNPASWGSNPTYAAALLKEIQKIEESVGAEMML